MTFDVETPQWKLEGVAWPYQDSVLIAIDQIGMEEEFITKTPEEDMDGMVDQIAAIVCGYAIPIEKGYDG